jgi:hypothetical protein
MVKTILYVITDVEGRRHGSRIGLDTLVVHADNDECHKYSAINIAILFYKRKCKHSTSRVLRQRIN